MGLAGGLRAGDELVKDAVHVTYACCQMVGHLPGGPATEGKRKEFMWLSPDPPREPWLWPLGGTESPPPALKPFQPALCLPGGLI